MYICMPLYPDLGYECEQVIRIPATSVWCVWCMKNGDIVAGSRLVL